MARSRKRPQPRRRKKPRSKPAHRARGHPRRMTLERQGASPAFPASRAADGRGREVPAYFLVSSFFGAAAFSDFLPSPLACLPSPLAFFSAFGLSALAFFSALGLSALAFFSVLALADGCAGRRPFYCTRQATPGAPAGGQPPAVWRVIRLDRIGIPANNDLRTEEKEK